MLKTWIRDNISPDDFITSSGQLPFDPTCAAKGPNTGMSETRRRRNFEANEPDGNLGGQRALVMFRLGNFLVILNVRQNFARLEFFVLPIMLPPNLRGLIVLGTLKGKAQRSA